MVRLQWWRDYFCIFNVQAFLGPAPLFPNIQITGTFTRVTAWVKMYKNTFGLGAEKSMENEASSSHRGIICVRFPNPEHARASQGQLPQEMWTSGDYSETSFPLVHWRQLGDGMSHLQGKHLKHRLWNTRRSATQILWLLTKCKAWWKLLQLHSQDLLSMSSLGKKCQTGQEAHFRAFTHKRLGTLGTQQAKHLKAKSKSS